MVYVLEGVAHADCDVPQGPEHHREPTQFAYEGPLDLVNSELHLYVSAACPWAHRVLIVRNMSDNVRSKVTVSVVSPFLDDALGWVFLNDDNRESVQRFDALPVTVDKSPLRARALIDVYLKSTPDYTGRITTPVLYDAVSNKILSTDSFHLMRLLASSDSALAHLCASEKVETAGRGLDESLGKRVDMCAVAKTQEEYETHTTHIYEQLDLLEEGFASCPRVCGNTTTLVDIQLLVILVRYDPVYFDLFKCFKRRLASYPNLSTFAVSLAEELGAENFALDCNQVVHHYWTSFKGWNPNGVVPLAYRAGFLDCGISKFRDGGESAVDASADAKGQDQAAVADRKARGEFVRGVAAHRNWLGDADFPLEPNRYVMFVANNCPWCHRVLMARAIYPGMEDLIGVALFFYRRVAAANGKSFWRFVPGADVEGENGLCDFERSRPELLEGLDTVDPTGNGVRIAPDVYQLADPASTETSVPILFDTKTKRVVSNESADIVRMLAMLSGSFDESRLEEINTLNFRIYHEVNNGAYKAGFSSNQETHEKACATYFRALDWLNTKLANSRYLITNDAPTEVDLRLFPTIYRHDPVYHSRMKLNVAMVRDYVHLNRWLLDMKSFPAVMRSSRLEHSMAGYFGRSGNALVPFVGLEHDGVANY